MASFEAKRIDKELGELRNGMAALSERGAGGESDPQVAVLARLLSKDRDFVRTMLIAAAALLVEVGSGLGLWLALGHWETRQRKCGEMSVVNLKPIPVAANEAAPMPSPTAPGLVGEVVDFCFERLHPAPGSVLTVIGLYRSYEVWCRERDLTPQARNRFVTEMVKLARHWGIESAGDTFIGVRVGMAIDWQ